MRYLVRWTSIAKRDLASIILYIARENPRAAPRVGDRIEKRAAALDRLPARGRVVPEVARLHTEEFREIQVPPYRLIYRIYGDRVAILGVLDSRRNLEDFLLSRLLYR